MNSLAIPYRISDDGPNEDAQTAESIDRFNESVADHMHEDVDVERAISMWAILGLSDDELLDRFKIARMNAHGWAEASEREISEEKARGE